MHKVCRLNLKLLMLCLLVGGALAASTQLAIAQSQTQSTSELTARIQDLEKQLAELAAKQNTQTQVAAAPAQGQRGAQTPAAPAAKGNVAARLHHPAATGADSTGGTANVNMPPGPGGNPQIRGTPPDSTDPQALLDRIKTLELRIRDLESTTHCIRSLRRTKKKEVYVDKNGIETEHAARGAKSRDL